jgi:hypothetical protein
VNPISEPGFQAGKNGPKSGKILKFHVIKRPLEEAGGFFQNLDFQFRDYGEYLSF